MTNCWVYEDADGQVRVKMKWIVPDYQGVFHGGVNDDRVILTEKGWRIAERIATKKYPLDKPLS